MRVSVIIPTLNEERFLPTTLTRATACAFEELIVVDGGSRDRTREIVEAFEVRGSRFDVTDSGSGRASHEVASPTSNLEPRTLRFICPVILLTSPPGRARQMNTGASAGHGDVLLFLHADTLLPSNASQAIEGALKDPAYVGGRFDVRFQPDSGWGWLISRMMNLRSRWTGIATGDQALFVRRTVFERLGGFSDMPIMEDVEFSRRLKRAGRIAALSSTAITSYRRWDSQGPLRTILLMWGLRSLYWMGMSPHRLIRKYADVR